MLDALNNLSSCTPLTGGPCFGRAMVPGSVFVRLLGLIILSCVLIYFFPALLAAGPADAEMSDAQPSPDDEHLRGFIEGWLLFAHGLDAEQVEVTVRDGEVTLTGAVPSVELADRLVATVISFAGVAEVTNRLEIMPPEPLPEAESAPAQGTGRWQSWLEWAETPPDRKTVHFPSGHLFFPPLADQKQPRFHTTWQRYDSEYGYFNMASVGFGMDFGLLRRPARREGDGIQLGISGAVFSLFNLDAPSMDLINSDFIVGFPLSWREGKWSARLRAYHQSSHLGDEYLLYPQPGKIEKRINLSYEAAELLVSREIRFLRFYGGGTGIFHSDTPLGWQQYQWGVDFRGSPIGWRTARVVAGMGFKVWEETDWDLDFNLKAGLRFRSPYSDAHSIELLLEYYDGHMPHGQFYNLTVDYFGLGIAYGF